MNNNYNALFNNDIVMWVGMLTVNHKEILSGICVIIVLFIDAVSF
jgi:hypothetical protein